MLSFNYAGAGLCILGAHLLVGKAVGSESKYKGWYSCLRPGGDSNVNECKHVALLLEAHGFPRDPEGDHFCVPSSAESDSYPICVARNLVSDQIQYPGIEGLSPGYWKKNGDHWDLVNCPKDQKCAFGGGESCCVGVDNEDEIKEYRRYRTGVEEQ